MVSVGVVDNVGVGVASVVVGFVAGVPTVVDVVVGGSDIDVVACDVGVVVGVICDINI